VSFLGSKLEFLGVWMNSTKPLIVPLWAAAKKCKQLHLAHTIPYRKDEVPRMGLYVTECTQFAAPSPDMVFRVKDKVIGKG
jgi:hypothetical protein